MPPIFYWFLACFLVSLGGIVAAVILVVAQNRKRKIISNNKEQVYVKSTQKTNSKFKGKARYFVEFVARNGAAFQLEVKQSLYDQLYVNDIGTLVHKRNTILFFEKKKQTLPTFFNESKSTTKTMQVTMDSPRFNLAIQRKDQVYATLDEVMRYLDRMLENKKDNFIALEDEAKDLLEISANDQGVIDIRFLQRNITYQLHRIDFMIVKTIVKSFFNKVNLVETFDFQPEK